MKFKQLIHISILPAFLLALGGCSQETEFAVDDEDVVLVEVDGTPVTLPMLEFLMEARGVSEDQPEQMRELLDELIRLQAMANAADQEGISERAPVRAERRIKDIEVRYVRYLEDFQREHPVSDSDIRSAYQEQVERAGDQRYRIEAVGFEAQGEAQQALKRLAEGTATFEVLAEQAESDGRSVLRPDWIDASQLPPDFAAALDATEVDAVVDAPLVMDRRWLVARVLETESLEPPPLDEVREGIRRTLVRQRNQALIEEMFEAAQITPMLPLDEADEVNPDDGASDE